MEIFRLFGSIFVDNAEANKSIHKTGEEAEKSGGFLSKLGGIAAGVGKAVVTGVGVAATAFAGLSAKALSMGGDLEQSVGGIETLFKDSADTVIANAEKAYLTAGVNANDYMQQVTSFSASLLQSLGGDTEAAAQVADMAIIDMADNANKMGSSIESIQNAYQGFAKQNYTMLDNLKLGYGGTKEEMARLLADAEKISGVEYDMSNLNDVYQAIHVIQEELDITGTTAKEGMETLSGSLTTAKAALDNFLMGSGNVDDLVDTLTNAANVIMDNLEELLPRLTQGLSELVDKLIPQVPPLLSRIMPSIIEGATVLLDGVLQAFPELAKVLIDILPMVSENILSMLPVILKAGIEILTTLALAIADALPDLIPVAVEAVITLVETLIDNIDMLIDAAISITMALADGLIESLPLLIEKAPTIIAKLVAAIVENVPKLLTAASEVVKKLAIGIIDNLPEIGKAAGQIIKTIDEGVKNLISDVIAVGKHIVEGFWEGIKNSGDWLKEKVSGFFGGIVDGVKNLFGIKSPSKVFSGIGEMLGEGFVDGVESMSGKIDDVVDDVFGGINRDVSANISASMVDLEKLPSMSSSLKANVPGSSDIDDSIMAALIAGFSMVADTIMDALPETLKFYLNDREIAEGLFVALEDSAIRRNRIFAPSQEQITAIAMT